MFGRETFIVRVAEDTMVPRCLSMTVPESTAHHRQSVRYRPSVV